MVGFEERWDAMITALRIEADTLQVPPDRIIKLDLGQQPPTAAPFVWVAMIPGDFTAGIDGRAMAHRATVECFCGAGPQPPGRSSMAAATTLAARVLQVLATADFVQRLAPQPIVPDTVTTLYTTTNLQFATEVWYAESA